MAKRYDLIVFDWDGTVMDSTAIIAGSIQAACRVGRNEPSDAAAACNWFGVIQLLRHAVPDVQDNQRDDGGTLSPHF
jgi:phosphoglycolate phosphatase